MALERKWLAVAPQAFTLDGTSLGVVTIADTAGFYTKQSVAVSSDDQQTRQLQVQEVLSSTQLVLGSIGPKVGTTNFVDMSGYLVSDNSEILAPSQNKNNIPDKDHYAAVYEADPIVADRVIFVDKYGRFYDQNNPLPIGSAGGGGLAPTDFDDVKISRDADDDPILYTFYLASAIVGQIAVFYNANKSSIEYRKL